MSAGERAKSMVEREHELSVGAQCALVGVARSTFYYQAAPEASDSERLRQAILRIYERRPIYGVRRIHDALKREGFSVGERRTRHLVRELRLWPVGHKLNLSKPAAGDKKFPYLLRGLEIIRPNQVWAMDITYLRVNGGFLYMTAVIDWYSRKILAWRISNTLDCDFCIEALSEAAAVYGVPEIVNTDQGSQFTADDFVKAVIGLEAKLSMDGKGRAIDNVIIERFWKSLKYEEVLIRENRTARELRQRVAEYVQFYNTERPHQSHKYRTPAEVYRERLGLIA